MKTSNEILAIIEAILFLNGEDGVSLKTLEAILEDEKPSTLKRAVAELQTKYQNDQSSALAIQEFGQNKYRLHTKPELYPFLKKSETVQGPSRLSMSTLEVLAVIAYQGPLTRHDIESVRRSDSTYQLMKLKELNLIHVVGRKAETRANLYQVTDNFYKLFNLQDLAVDLPPVNVHSWENSPTSEVQENQLFQTINETIFGDLGEN